MTLLREKGTFTKTTTAVNGTTQEINLSGAFQPKILILWTAGQTTSNGTYADHTLWSYGWSDGTTDICQAYRAHETNENEVYVFRDDAIISIMSLTAGSEVSRASVASYDSDGFTLTWDVQSDTNAMVIHYIAIGGTDITNVSAFSSTHQNTSTGNHSWNGSGDSFTPEFALVMSAADNVGISINTIQNLVDVSDFQLGAATGTSNQWSIAFREETSATSDTDSLFENANCLGVMNAGSGARSYIGSFVSFDNAAGGGITINISVASANATNPIAFLLVAGGEWDCQAFQQRNGTGTQNVSLTNSSVTPKLVQLTGISTATAATLQANSYAGIGASDGTNEGNVYNGSTDALGTWVTARSTDTDKVYRIATPAATATSSTTNAQCDMNDMSTAGQFTLDWTTADATLRWMGFWMVGEVVGGGGATDDGGYGDLVFDLFPQIIQT